jgi:predicted transposase YdaD
VTRKDVISKEVIRHLAADMANVLLELDIDPASLELMETEQQRVEDRRADLVARVRPRDGGAAYVLHIEIQNNNDATMAWRMLRYLTDIRLRYPKEQVRQHLVYIGRARVNMATSLEEADISYRYHLLNMASVDCAALLSRDSPDALALALLCDFGDRDPQTVVNGIFLRLRDLCGDNSRRLREYIDMIEVLSENRDLQPFIREAENMLTQVDVTRLPSYELGMKKGREEGLEDGARSARVAVARNLLPVLSDAQIADSTGLSEDEIARLRAEAG